MKYPLKLIEWQDAFNGNHDWCETSVLEDQTPVVVQTIGFEVKRDKDYITLAMSTTNTGRLCDLFTIPLTVVVREQTFRSRLR